MNPTQAENLRILIRHMETLPRMLTMNTFFAMHDPECKTPACALGEATTLARFRDILSVSRTSAGGWVHGGRAAFGATERLFGTKTENAFGTNAVTPQEWAVEARKVLAENGYSMDEPKPVPSVAERLALVVAGAACPDWKSGHRFTDCGGKAGTIIRAERATEESLRDEN